MPHLYSKQEQITSSPQSAYNSHLLLHLQLLLHNENKVPSSIFYTSGSQLGEGFFFGGGGGGGGGGGEGGVQARGEGARPVLYVKLIYYYFYISVRRCYRIGRGGGRLGG